MKLSFLDSWFSITTENRGQNKFRFSCYPFLQFDTLICNKEKECEELQATLSRKDEIISNTNNKLQDLESMVNSQNQKILELQDLASVQKEHLSSVELGAKDDVERLKLEIEQLQGTNFTH